MVSRFGHRQTVFMIVHRMGDLDNAGKLNSHIEKSKSNLLGEGGNPRNNSPYTEMGSVG